MTIALILLALVGALAFYVAKQPDEFSYSRSLTMNAPTSAIFPHVNNQRQWQAWSPWAKLDPNAKTTFDGAESGVGAVMAWDGNNQVGKGKSTIIDSQQDRAVRFRLDFEKPMKATNTADFTFTAQGDQTVVIWSMSGKNTVVGKIVGLVMNCEKMCNAQFDKGLANLKAIVEAR